MYKPNKKLIATIFQSYSQREFETCYITRKYSKMSQIRVILGGDNSSPDVAYNTGVMKFQRNLDRK